MKAIVYHQFGFPDVLELREIEKPPLTDDGVLVRVLCIPAPASWIVINLSPAYSCPRWT